MPSLKNIVTEVFDDLKGFIVTAWAPTTIYYGRPRLETPDKFAVIDLGTVPGAASAARGVVQTLRIRIFGIFPRPTTKTDSVLFWLVDKSDDLVELIEGVTVWPGGGVNAYITSKDFDDEGEDNQVGLSIELTIEYHCQIGT